MKKIFVNAVRREEEVDEQERDGEGRRKGRGWQWCGRKFVI